MSSQEKRPPQDVHPPSMQPQLDRAEAALLEPAAQPPDSIEAMSPEAMRKTWHELQVHQIELEMQNKELRRTLLELDAAQARYFDLYDLAPVGYLSLSERGLILQANLTAATLLGMSRSTLIQQPISHFILAADQDIYYQHRQQLLETEQAQACELRMLKPDGTPFWAQLDAISVQGEHTEPRLRLVLSDITARKRVEQALAESELFNQSILNSLAAEIAVLDREGKILAVNQPWRRFALDNGITPGHAASLIEVGANYLSVCQAGIDVTLEGARESKAAIDGIRAVLEGRLPSFSLEYPCHSPQQQRWMSMVVTPLVEAGLGVVISHSDISERILAQQALAESEERFRLFMDTLPAAAFIKDADGRTLFANRYLADLMGGLSWLGKPTRELFPPALAEKMLADDRRSLEVGYLVSEEHVPDRDGLPRVFQTHKFRIPLHGRPHLLGGIALDNTLQKQTEEQLRLAASVFTHAREGIMITAADGAIIEVNDAFSRITGYHRDEVLGRNPHLLSSGRQETAFYAAMWRDLIEEGHWYGELWNRRKNGEEYAALQTISAVRDAQGKTRQYVALFSDITTIKAHEKQLEHIAHYDALTALPSRVLLADRMHQAMTQVQRRGQLLAVVFLDLDGFKAINDNHGHEAGDQLLIAMATHMKQALREGDTLARLGGDEFVAVLLDLEDAAASEPLLHRLLAAAAQPVQIGHANQNLVLQVSASLGVTFYPQGEDVDADQLLRQADHAMYLAKLAGKNRYHVFDSGRDRDIRGHHESLERLRHALAAREFVLHYQPKVNMRTGKVIGAEALIRWQHPEKGLLEPALFLPLIGEHPLAEEVGEWVIDTALTQIGLWRSQGLHTPVSVNVGARQLQQTDFVARLREILAAHPDINPGDLELEVLETSALANLARVSQVIEACREIGVMFALDDFGTGYSSLTYLKHLHVNQLKIDRSFVHDMLDDPDDLAILEGVIGMSTAFRRQVIAEGVETLAHGVMLLQLGCELAQGFGIARPMPAHELPGWLAAWRPDAAWTDLALVSHDDLPLLFANVKHRAWIAAFVDFLKGERAAPPPLDHHLCRFGLWLDGEGLAHHGDQPAYRAIEPLHQEVHALAAELLELQAQGQTPEALARLSELYALQGALLEQLQILARENRPARSAGR
jgi:diguanylate cyclase (GGDEF)-like protein/PAS domain S-box-containing protein